MATQPSPASTEHHTDVFAALADRQRRRTLAVLQRIDHATPAELARHVAAESDEPPVAVAPEAAEQVHQELKHRHLPKLAAADLVTRDDGTVSTTDHPALQDPTITAIIETEAAGCDAVCSALADRRRRVALTALVRADGGMNRTELVGVVDEVLGDGGASQSTVERLQAEFHHSHLPALEEAGLIQYDEETADVVYEGHAALDEAWLVGGVERREDVRTEIPL